MDLLKTVKLYVAGSEKIFDIYACTVEEVERYKSSTEKGMIRVKIDGKEYTGLHNKWVYNYICDNEGTPSFVVMWRSPKGDPMLAYVKDLWVEHISGASKGEVPKETEAYPAEGHPCFLYMWVNKDDDRKYIGMHCGETTDGYVCSSDRMLAEFGECPSRFLRTVLAYGTAERMLALETLLLLQLDVKNSPLYYNLSNNLQGNRYGS